MSWKFAKKLLQGLPVSEMEEMVIAVCSDISITTEYEDPIHATRRSLSDYFKMTGKEGKATVRSKMEQYKTVAVKKLLKELDHRFNHMSSVVLESIINSLDAGSTDYLDYDTMQPLLNHYNSQLNICDTLLSTECSRAKLMHQFGNYMIPDMYPNLQKLIRLSRTIPVNTAGNERGFSCMNRVISYARNSLTTETASDLMLLSLNKDLLMNIDVDYVIKKWSGKKKRHIPLF